MVGSDAALDAGIQQENKSGLLSNMGGADMMRQVTMILALAVCLALAVIIMMWAQEPEYRPLGKMETS